jgi:DNA polymerase-3 subunit epsilon
MNFVAIDVETANADMASICQIGMARFTDGVVTGEWSSLINPEDYFDPFNTDIHGISGKDVKRSPKFPTIVSSLSNFIEDSICVSYSL